MAHPLYFVDMHIIGLSGNLYFNDVPIATVNIEGRRTVLQVSHWIVDGINRMSFVSIPNSQGVFRTPNYKFSAILSQSTADVIPGEEPFVELMRMDAPGSVNFSSAVEVASPFPRWKWEDAEIVELNEQATTSSFEFVRQIHQMVSKRDINEIEGLSQTIFDEVAPAFGIAPTVAREEFRRRYTKLFQRSGFSIKPLVFEQFSPKLCANGRLVELCLIDGRPVLQQLDIEKNGGWLLPMFIGRVGGSWQLLRS